MMTDPQWYKDAIFYELHVRAFYDSSGDGNGDFPGLIQKLDYLQSLGVDTLWLLPASQTDETDAVTPEDMSRLIDELKAIHD